MARKRRRRTMPAGLRRYWAAKRAGNHKRRRRSNPHRHARIRTRTRTIVRYRTRGRRRSNPRINRHRSYGNPMFGGMSTTDLLYMGGGALVNGIITRAVPASVPFLSGYNNGIQGYALNVMVGGAAAWGISKFNRRAGQGAWIGMIVAVGQRIVAEHFGSGAAAPAAAAAAAAPAPVTSGALSGDMDFALGYYTEEPFPYPQGASAGPYQQFPGTPYAGQAAFPSTNASAVRAGNAVAAAALAPAGAAAPAQSVQQATAMNAPGWGAHGWA